MTSMTDPAPAPERDSAAAVEALEGAFRRITQVVKRNVREFATAIHPELRHAGWIVLNTVLRAAADGRAVTVGEIIVETGMDKSVVSRQLRALGDWGLVTMRRSDADARVVVVDPTELARDRIAVVRQRQRERYAEVLKDWSAEDVGRLEVLLGRLADAVAVSDS